jgi:glycosyltransferase involved in cell wall biosynthesis
MSERSPSSLQNTENQDLNGHKILLLPYTTVALDPPVLNLGISLANKGAQPRILGVSADGLASEMYLGILPIIRIPVRRPSWLRALTYSALMVWTVLRWAPDLVVVFTWRPFLIALPICRLLGLRLVYYQTEFTEPLSRARQEGLVVRSLLKIETACVRAANKVYSVEPHRSRLMKTKYALTSTPSFIYNCPRLRTPQGTPSRGDRTLKIVYAGGINRNSGILDALLALSTLPGDFSIDCYGPVESEIDAVFNNCIQSDPRFSYHGVVSYPLLQTRLPTFDVGLVTYRATTINQVYCSPGKLFEYMAAGVAVLCSDLPSLKRVIRESNAGLCFSDISTLLQLVSRLMLDPHVVTDLKGNAIEAHKRVFNYEHQAGPLLDYLVLNHND